METNRYGLPRRIPNGIKRRIRQNAGFGCVICGCAIYQYEHVEPTFANARSHNPENMTLLCGTCHDQVTRGIFSKDKVKEMMKNPKSKQTGFTFGFFDIGDAMPSIRMGDSFFSSSTGLVLIEIDGKEILKFERPEFVNSPFLLSASFYDAGGNLSLNIEKNEWQGAIQNWDIEVVGKSIKIREKLSEFVLEIINIPRESFVINQIDMEYNGYKIIGNNKSGFKLTTPQGGGVDIQGCAFDFGDADIEKVAFQCGESKNILPRLCAFKF